MCRHGRYRYAGIGDDDTIETLPVVVYEVQSVHAAPVLARRDNVMEAIDRPGD